MQKYVCFQNCFSYSADVKPIITVWIYLVNISTSNVSAKVIILLLIEIILEDLLSPTLFMAQLFS